MLHISVQLGQCKSIMPINATKEGNATSKRIMTILNNILQTSKIVYVPKVDLAS